jgi:hypothetical protein
MATVSEPGSRCPIPGCGTSAMSRSREPAILWSLLGGLVGTLAITLMVFVVDPILTGRTAGIARLLSSKLGSPHWAGEMAFHLFNGVILYPLGFAFFSGRLPGPRVVKGLIWGFILWILAQGLVIPLMGADSFGSPGGGIMAAISSLANHLVYGGLQGLIAGIATAMDTLRGELIPSRAGVSAGKLTRPMGGA